VSEPAGHFDIRPIAADDRLNGLSLGDGKFTPLKIFLQKHARTLEAQSLARTYGVFEAGGAKVLGYITLVCGEIVADPDEVNLTKDPAYRYRHYPAVKIARLAVDKNVRKNGLGKVLIELALGIAKDRISTAAGCRFLVVDSKQDAVEFYQKRGFTLLGTQTNLMRSDPILFIDLHKA